ncbi:MAG TPA: hypothetical protein VK060_02260 [Ruania sp.]|nr:hypothetical protein [Ruania sp.]
MDGPVVSPDGLAELGSWPGSPVPFADAEADGEGALVGAGSGEPVHEVSSAPAVSTAVTGRNDNLAMVISSSA